MVSGVRNEPGYLALYRSGELEDRVRRLEKRLASCDICPRECRVDRLAGETSFCNSAAKAVVHTVCAHHGEEPVLSGNRGSGTIFFSNCNLRCVYCQNFQISQNRDEQSGREMDCLNLAKEMLYLQNELGCHNINLVSPSHFVPQIVGTVLEAVPMGLNLPLVYNTNAYDSVETLRELDGIISIYLPDIKYADDKWAVKFSRAPGYVARSRAAIREMYRQVGNLVLDEAGIAQRGLIVRHLILPNDVAGSRDSLTWLAKEISPAVTLSLMSQYYPAHRAPRVPLLARTITKREYSEVIELVNELGLENGWLQEMGASAHYRPDFDRPSSPFDP